MRGGMRILHCIPALSAGGAERQLAILSRMLPRYGWDVQVASLAGGIFEDALDPATTLHRLTSTRNRDPRVLLQLAQLIGRIKPDLIQTWLLKMDVLGGLAALARSVPWIATERNCAANYPRLWTTRLRTFLVPRADALVANSAGGLASWQRRSARQIQRIIANGVDPMDGEGALPADIGAANVILYSGRFVTPKRLPVLLQALVRVRREVPGTLILCGFGPHEDELRRLASELDLADAVIFAGIVRDMWPVIWRADLAVSLSRFEGAPNAVQEAMACGTPVVLSDMPAHREIVDEDAGWFVDGDDPAAVAATIVECIRDREKARARAARAQSIAQAWTAEAMAAQYDAVYRQVLEARRRGVTFARPLTMAQ